MCSYCGCSELSLIGRYMAEHEEIINRCGDLRRAVDAGDADAVDTARTHLADLLTPHTVSEERSLFAVLREDEMFTHEVDSLCGEHDALDELLAAVTAGDPASATAFEDRLRIHIDREDNSLFPASAVSLTGPDWDRITDLDEQVDYSAAAMPDHPGHVSPGGAGTGGAGHPTTHTHADGTTHTH